MFRSNIPPQGLPDGWTVSQLRDFCHIHSGGRLGVTKSEYQTSGVEAFSAAGQDGFVSQKEGDAPSIILASIGSCGRSYLTNGPWTTLANTQVITPNLKIAEPRFLHALLDNPSYWNISGSAQPFIKPSDVKSAWVPLPPLDEQRRIAEVLLSLNEAIAANKDALASCREVVGKLARDVTESCEATTTMASLGKIVTGRTPSPKQADLWGGELPFVTPGDLVAGNVSVSDASRTLVADSNHGATVLPANSVLVTCIGSTVGKTAIARKRCVTNQQINAVCCPPQIAGFAYLASVAAYDTIVANAGKQAVPIINKSTFSAIEVPELSQAKMVEISAMVDAIDGEIVAAQTALGTLYRTKASLMSDLLSGRVRVPA